jgi:hypothetical protein
MVAVRVNPSDHSEVALSLGEEPPTVKMAAADDGKTGSAAEVLERGEDCRVVIIQSQPPGTQNAAGHDVYALLPVGPVRCRAPLISPNPRRRVGLRGVTVALDPELDR